MALLRLAEANADDAGTAFAQPPPVADEAIGQDFVMLAYRQARGRAQLGEEVPQGIQTFYYSRALRDFVREARAGSPVVGARDLVPEGVVGQPSHLAQRFYGVRREARTGRLYFTKSWHTLKKQAG